MSINITNVKWMHNIILIDKEIIINKLSKIFEKCNIKIGYINLGII